MLAVRYNYKNKKRRTCFSIKINLAAPSFSLIARSKYYINIAASSSLSRPLSEFEAKSGSQQQRPSALAAFGGFALTKGNRDVCKKRKKYGIPRVEETTEARCAERVNTA